MAKKKMVILFATLILVCLTIALAFLHLKDVERGSGAARRRSLAAKDLYRIINILPDWSEPSEDPQQEASILSGWRSYLQAISSKEYPEFVNLQVARHAETTLLHATGYMTQIRELAVAVPKSSTSAEYLLLALVGDGEDQDSMLLYSPSTPLEIHVSFSKPASDALEALQNVLRSHEWGKPFSADTRAWPWLFPITFDYPYVGQLQKRQ